MKGGRNMIDVCLLGTGGTMPLPDRALTSLLLRYNGHTFLVDCGEGTQVQIRKSGFSMHDIDVILITHFHADHVTGLSGLLLSMAKSERREKVTIVAPKGGTEIIRCLCITSPVMPFELEIKELTEMRERFELYGLIIDAVEAEHSVLCYAYSFTLSRKGRFDAEKARTLGVIVKDWKLLQNGTSVIAGGRTITPEMVLGAPRKGIKVTYCTDTRPLPRLTELAMDSDLLICEGMYAEEDKLKMAIEKKHMIFFEAAKTAHDANAKKLWLTHFSPALDDPQSYSDYIKAKFDNSLIPNDLEKIELRYT